MTDKVVLVIVDKRRDYVLMTGKSNEKFGLPMTDMKPGEMNAVRAAYRIVREKQLGNENSTKLSQIGIVSHKDITYRIVFGIFGKSDEYTISGEDLWQFIEAVWTEGTITVEDYVPPIMYKASKFSYRLRGARSGVYVM
jgi:hypothetical protein